MERKEIRYYEDKCTQNEPPNCTTQCPLHLDVKSLMAAVAGGRFREGAKIVYKSLPFPRLIAHLCPSPCRKVCERQTLGGSIDIPGIERAVLDLDRGNHPVLRQIAQRQERIAVIGNDLTGLVAATFLYEKGYQVTYFEVGEKLGSALWPFLGVNGLSEQDLMLDFEPFLHSNIIVEYRYDGAYPPREGDGFDRVYNSIASGQSLSIIEMAAKGRSAAITLDREMKNASLTEGRENEGVYESRLNVNKGGVESAPPIQRLGDDYDRDGAIAEAGRCLQCQCMLCVEQCPFLAQYGSYPKKYVREIANNVNMTLGVRQTKNMVNSCAYCGLCGEICPNGLDMTGVCFMGKEELVAKGAMPETIHDFPIRDMVFSNSSECAFFLPQPGQKESRNLFFPGCQMIGLRPVLVEKAYDFLLTHLADGVG